MLNVHVIALTYPPLTLCCSEMSLSLWDPASTTKKYNRFVVAMVIKLFAPPSELLYTSGIIVIVTIPYRLTLLSARLTDNFGL